MTACLSTVTMNGVTKRMDDVVDRRGCGKWQPRFTWAFDESPEHQLVWTCDDEGTAIVGVSDSSRCPPDTDSLAQCTQETKTGRLPCCEGETLTHAGRRPRPHARRSSSRLKRTHPGCARTFFSVRCLWSDAGCRGSRRGGTAHEHRAATPTCNVCMNLNRLCLVVVAYSYVPHAQWTVARRLSASLSLGLLDRSVHRTGSSG
jgi:hypothetical protein